MTIAGIAVPMAPGLKVQYETIGGAPGRAESGQLRSDARAHKLGFAGQTAFLTRAEAAALRAAVALDAPVAVDASLYESGAVIMAMVRIEDGDVISAASEDGTHVLRTLSLVVREV